MSAIYLYSPSLWMLTFDLLTSFDLLTLFQSLKMQQMKPYATLCKTICYIFLIKGFGPKVGRIFIPTLNNMR